jgi:hypothetical protein
MPPRRPGEALAAVALVHHARQQLAGHARVAAHPTRPRRRVQPRAPIQYSSSSPANHGSRSEVVASPSCPELYMVDHLIIDELCRAASRSLVCHRRLSAAAMCGGESKSCPNVRQTAHFALFFSLRLECVRMEIVSKDQRSYLQSLYGFASSELWRAAFAPGKGGCAG